MIRHRRCQGAVEHALEVEWTEVSRAYIGDHGKDEPSAVRHLLLPVRCDHPVPRLGRRRVEVVLDQCAPFRPKLGGGDPDVQPFGQLGGLGERLGS